MFFQYFYSEVQNFQKFSIFFSKLINSKIVKNNQQGLCSIISWIKANHMRVLFNVCINFLLSNFFLYVEMFSNFFLFYNSCWIVPMGLFLEAIILFSTTKFTFLLFVTMQIGVTLALSPIIHFILNFDDWIRFFLIFLFMLFFWH